MNNMAITRNMLWDNKHLDLKKNGFFIFLANIKFLLFGHIPFLNNYQPHRNRNSWNTNRNYINNNNNNNRRNYTY